MSQVPLRTLHRWIKGPAEAPFARLADIARAAGVSLDWLAYGIDRPAAPALDEQRLLNAIAAVEEYLEEVDERHLAPEKKAILIVDLYTGAMPGDGQTEVDHAAASQRLGRLIRLVR